jgi:hypothetical protein
VRYKGAIKGQQYDTMHFKIKRFCQITGRLAGTAKVTLQRQCVKIEYMRGGETAGVKSSAIILL